MIRLARPDDTSAIVELLRESIVVLCGPIYRNDPKIMEAWLENKQDANIIQWMRHPLNRMIVSIDENSGEIAGVGLSRTAVESNTCRILLCYVHPRAVGRGHGSTLLSNLEEDLRDHGSVEVVTNATLNSANFYFSKGYVAKAVDANDPISIQMAKVLVALV